MSSPKRYEEQVKPYLEQIKEWTRNGATNDEIATALGVGRSTFYRYLKSETELKEAIKEGRQNIIFNIRAALLKRALGYEYEETKTTVKKTGTDIIETTETIKKKALPDVSAASILLRNYDESFRDKDHKVNELKEEELKLKKQIANNNNFDYEGEDDHE